MGPDTIWVFIPLTAIVLGIGSGIVKMILQSIERHHELKALGQQATGGVSDQQMQELRSELAQLRDISTQFAISQDHSLHRLEQRIEHLERQSNAGTGPTGSADASPPTPVVTYEVKTDAPVQQVIGRTG